MRHEATKEEILEAAWGLTRDQGLTGFCLRDLALAVQMRHQSLYTYFPSKQAIYDAMFAQGAAGQPGSGRPTASLSMRDENARRARRD